MKHVLKSKRFASVKNQIFATLIANISCLAQGFAVGWTSPTIPLLLSDASPFASGPVSTETAAWIGSVLALGGALGTLLFGFCSNFIGSKRALLLSALPSMIHWIMLYCATEAWHVIVARFIVGLCGGGVFICFPLFIAEISSEHIRGLFGSLLTFFFYTGIILGYAVVGSLDYYTVPLVIVALPTCFFCLFFWVPNTPQFLLKQNRPEEAEKSLRFYRNIGKCAHDQDELNLTKELQKFVLIAQQNAEQPPLQVTDFLSRDAIRGMLIGITLMAVCQFSGTFTLSNYAKTIFRETGTNIDPNVASVIMGGAQVLGSIFASILVDRLGRKLLLLISTAGSATALAATGTFAHLSANGFDTSAWNVVPVVTLSFFICIACVGMATVPYVLVAEVLPVKVRRIGATIYICSVSVFAYIMLQFFPVLLAYMQLDGYMWMSACVSALGFVFTLVVVSETKGINLDNPSM